MVENIKQNSSLFPTISEIESASPYQILQWNRFLPSPNAKNEEEIKSNNRIFDRYKELSKSGEINSNTSKQIGW